MTILYAEAICPAFKKVKGTPPLRCNWHPNEFCEAAFFFFFVQRYSLVYFTDFDFIIKVYMHRVKKC